MRLVTRPLSLVVIVTWLGVMAVLVHQSYAQAGGNLATDLARYGSSAQWRGVYYRGEKIGFTVSQTVPLDAAGSGDGNGGFELQEDGQLQMSLLGVHTFTKLKTRARVDRSFELQSFEFALDPGTGPITITGEIRDRELAMSIASGGTTRTEVRTLAERPMLTLNLVRRLANAGLTPGARHKWMVFDPATLRNAPVTVSVGEREVVRGGAAPIPAFRVEMEFTGLRTTAWITDTGEIVREESPLGFITVRETADQAQALAVSGRMRKDLLESAAVVPEIEAKTPPLPPIGDPRSVRLLRMRVTGADLTSPDLQGAGQRVRWQHGRDRRCAEPRRLDPQTAISHHSWRPSRSSRATTPRFAPRRTRPYVECRLRVPRAEALTRYVNATLQKKPTVSIPSAREVLRTKIGDCNEHTALFVAMSRSLGLPSRIAVGLAYVRGAFYYHAWPEVYIEDRANRGYWLPVDPTFNQFPADATHLRLARGGLEKQAAILPMIGNLQMTIVALDVTPESTPILVGREAAAGVPPAVANLPRPRASRWCLPCFLGGHE